MSDEKPIYEIPEYVPTEGTVKISGATLPKPAGKCAFHYLEKGIFPVDFHCIGANANQQAMKAMGVFLYMVNSAYQGKMSVAFQPMRFRTSTIDPTTQLPRDKDCVVWRTVVIQ